MRKPARVSASSTIQPEHPRVADPDAPEASVEAEWPPSYRRIRQIIPSVIQARSRLIGKSKIDFYREASVGLESGIWPRGSWLQPVSMVDQ